MRSAVPRWLSRPRAPAVIVALALVLLSPSLTTGLTADDYFHALVLTGKGDIDAIPDHPMALFVWADGEPAHARAMMEVGMTGWWTDPALVMAYFRPIAVATHWLDYRFWPDQPWLMHVHSLFWFGLSLVLLARLYPRLFAADPTFASGKGARGASLAYLPMLALLVFAIDDAHAMTVAWVANRNALCAFTLGLVTLLLHDRGARDGDVRAARVAPLALLVALLAGESALAVTGYLFAYALFLDAAPRRRALFRLAPYAAVVLVWGIIYRSLGYGARGSGLVVDPGGEPLRFAGKALERVPVLLSAELGFPPADLWEAYPMLAPFLPFVMFGVLLLLLVVIGLAGLPLLRAHPAARFFGLGMLLSALPVSAQFPSDRLLLFLGLGGAPLIALLIAPLFGFALSRPVLGARLQRGVAYAAVALHLVLAPLWLPLRARGPLDAERMIGAADRSIDATPAIRDKTVVLINPPLDAYAGYIPTRRAAQGTPRPRGLRWLATGASDLRIVREDVRSLRLRPADGFLSLPSERMQRNPARRMPVGHEVRFPDMTIEVVALTEDGRPAEIRARFDDPLEAPRYAFFYWHAGRFEPFPLPEIGGERALPRVDFASLLP